MQIHLNQIVNYLLTQSWQIAILAVLIAVISLALKNRSAHVRYLLWLIVLAKCLVPPFLIVPLAVLPQEKPKMVLEKTDTTFAESSVLPSTSPAKATTPILIERQAQVTIRQWLGFAWILGAILFVLSATIKTFRTNSWLRRQRKPLPAELQSCIGNLFPGLGLKTFPKVWLVEGIGQPFVWGLLRGGIYLPADFVKVNSDEHRRDVLCHELSHILRFDAAVNFLQVIAQAIFWFHPFVWWANKKIRAEREKCCDETAIARLDVKAKEYSSAIVNALIAEHESTRPVPSLAVTGPVKNIEERIKTIMKPGKQFYEHPSLKTVIILLLAALLTVPTGCAFTRRVKTETATEPETEPVESLHKAVATGDIEQVKSLIAKGADINTRDKEGRTALTLAKEKEHKEIVRLLRMHEAKEDIIKIDLFLLESSDSREVKEFLERENLEPSHIQGDPNNHAHVLNAGQVEQLLKLVRLNAKYKLLMNPTLEVVDGGTAIISRSARCNYVSGYSEPNRPSEEPKPILESVDIGDKLQVKPKLLPNSQDTMNVYFDFERSNLTAGSEKFMYKGKYPYEIPIIDKIAVATHYKITSGQTLLLCGWKITYKNDAGTEERELLVLVTTQIVEPKKAQDETNIAEVLRKQGA